MRARALEAGDLAQAVDDRVAAAAELGDHRVDRGLVAAQRRDARELGEVRRARGAFVCSFATTCASGAGMMP